jgi:hypothetical protein
MTETSGPGPFYVDVVVVACSCGMFPLDQAMQPTSRVAWEAAAAHVALNPTKCQPTMYRQAVPVPALTLAP